MLVPRSCNKLDCAVCSDDLTTRRGTRFHELNGRHGFGQWIVTLPQELRSRVTLGELKAMKGAVIKAIQQAYTDHGLGRIGGRYWWHPCGDICDGCGDPKRGKDLSTLGHCQACGTVATWKPHINVLVPMLSVQNGRRLRILPKWLPGSLLAQVRGLVRVFLNRIAARMGLGEQTANVKYKYKEPGADSGHAARYIGRVFAAWRRVLRLLPNGRDFGLSTGGARAASLYAKVWAVGVKVPDDLQGETSEPTCPMCGSDALCYGSVIGFGGRDHHYYLTKGYTGAVLGHT